MYNSNTPKHDELPSNKQLLVATFGALALAFVVLIVSILPAEFGVDPSGLGEKLGLLEMGTIKQQLAEEAAAEQALPQEQPTVAEPVIDTQSPSEADTSQVMSAQVDQASKPALVPTPAAVATRTIVLKPGEAAELKLAMKQDALVSYAWSVNQGHVNFDTHADNASTKYHGYNKGKAVTGDAGTLKAAFDGMHGWFWRNRSKQTVSVQLEISGDYTDIKRVL